MVEHPLKIECVNCLQFTSVRSLSRILQARNRLWRALWFIAVIVCFTVALYFISRLIEKYQNNDKVNEYRVYQIRNIEFPSVTLCNLGPIGAEKLRYFSEQSSLIRKIKSNEVYKKYLEGDSESKILFQNFVGWRSAAMDFDTFVVNGSCEYTIQNNSLTYKLPCNKDDVVNVANPEFFVCFMLNAPANVSRNIKRLSFNLFLDNPEPFEFHDEDLLDSNFGVGARVIIDTPNSYPREDKGIDLMAGSKTRIEFQPLEENIRPPCESDPSERKLHLSTASGNHHFYHTVGACKNLAKQAQLARKCNCVDVNLPIEANFTHLAYCKRMVNNDTWLTLKTLNCLDTMKFKKISRNKCPLNCHFIKYRTNLFKSKWPTNVGQFEFYDKFIKNSSIHSKRFPTINDIFNKQAKAYLDNNFLKVEIFRPDFSATIMSEHLVMTLPNLFSQIGGTLSLWSGCSMIVIVEISEFLFYAFKSCYQSKNQS